MKKLLLILAVVGVTAAAALAAGDNHVKVALEPVGGSGVTGMVDLKQLKEGGTDIHVHASGLTPGTTYASFYYDGRNCENGPDLIGDYTANADGRGHVKGTAEDDLDEIASVSVRSPDYSVLYACANVH